MDVTRNLLALANALNSNKAVAEKIKQAESKNPWFTENFVQCAIDAIASDMLSETKLNEWLTKYSLQPVDKTIGLIFAGNIPLVGFHDFLCAYVSGCRMKIKLSSKDDILFPFVLQLLSLTDSRIYERIELVETLKDFDAVIATGSDNTNRYFEYYFRAYPKILRKNRNSVAILNGSETTADLEKLADDIFMYFGFGCRNVSKIFVPAGYDITQLFPAFEKNYAWLHEHNKYMSNYDYHRTILLLNKTEHLSNNFIMLKESTAIASPIATLHYEYWHDENVLRTRLKTDAEKMQCLVSNEPQRWNAAASVRFGEAQHPQLYDYADGVDTLAFIQSLHYVN
jgi:hypothetical protein